MHADTDANPFRDDAATSASRNQVGQTRPWSTTTSPDEARHLCGGEFGPRRVKLLGSPKAFAYRQRVARIGPITIGDVTYATDVRIDFAEARTGYDIIIPLAGCLEASHRGVEMRVTHRLASVCRPEGEKTVTRWLGGSRVLAVTIDQSAMDTALERLIGQRPDSLLPLGPTLPLKDADARSWMHLLAAVEQLEESNTPAWRSLISAPLVDNLIHGFLLLADHPYRDALRAPVAPGRPSVVRLAVEIIRSNPELALTASSLAAQCNVSVRTLQAGFQNHLGTSPMTYLREERLRRAHLDLRSSDPSSTTVAAIAHRWSFTHLGRFAAAHRDKYGETPAQVLRSPA